MKNFTINTWILVVAFLGNITLMAQQIEKYEEINADYANAVELYNAEQYVSAQTLFQKIYETVAEKSNDLKANSYFYMGACAVELFNGDAEFLLNDFMFNYPINSHLSEAKFLLARVYFQNKQYKKALVCYQQIDEPSILTEDKNEYYFYKGYSAFYTGDYDLAKLCFSKVKQSDNPYTKKALYYNAYIAYEEKKYEVALMDFKELLNEEAYHSTVPFYMVQIYFIQQKYEDLIVMAPSLIAKAPEKRKGEMLRSVALSYYNLKRYKEAESYFEAFLKENKMDLPKTDNYAIGYTYYQNEQYAKAVPFLTAATVASDTLAQIAFYTIADCQVRLKNYHAAVQAFQLAYQLGFDEVITEDALYNYGKLQYETSSMPFQNSIKTFELYLEKYPNSYRSEEVNSYLSTIYLSTKNYAAALTSLEKISSKSPKLLRAYQRVAYYRALELINNRQYKTALSLIEKSLKYNFDKEIAVSNLYWKAETMYRMSDYKNAGLNYQQYIRGANSNATYYYPAYYGLAYTAMKQKKYQDAVTNFQILIKSGKTEIEEDIYQDALIRIADSYYMLEQMSNALAYYEKALKNSSVDADYILYQQAVIYGIECDYTQKCAILKQIAQMSKSSYAIKAEYELASAVYAMDKYAEAIDLLKNFVEKHPKNALCKNAYLKLAQAYLNINQSEEALKIYKLVFENYQGSKESQDALANLEAIYTENAATSEFFTYLQGRSNINISQGKQDSTAFKSGEIKYFRGDCAGAIKAFDNYLENFPEGFFAATAYFYRAECNYGIRNYEEALKDYEVIIAKYNTDYNETSCQKAADILLTCKLYEKSYAYYSKLLELATDENTVINAHTGRMRSANMMLQYQNVIDAATNIYTNPKADIDIKEEAISYMAKAYQQLGNYTDAKKYWTELAQKSTNDYAAEAAYLLAETDYREENYKACEQKITEMIAANYSSEYWFAKVFMLYGDLYMQRGNYLQAKTTYKSIIDGYTGTDLSKELEAKYNKAQEVEEAAKIQKKNQIENR